MPNYENGSRHADKFVVRLPDGLRSKVEAAADAEDTSMNTVCVKAIRRYVEKVDRQELLLDALENAVKARGEFDIAGHARMALNARRYLVLRDQQLRHDLCITIPTGTALDEFTDEALRSFEALNPLPSSQSAGDATQGETDEEWGYLTPETASALAAVANRYLDSASASTDPRNMFACINPIGASAEELEMGRNGFVDERTHADYLIFLAGYRAAQELGQ